MAVGKILSQLQLPVLIPTVFWNVSQRNCSKVSSTVLKKFGYPVKPKKPPTSYLTYLICNKDAAKAQNPDKSYREVTQLLLKEWKELPESERNKYKEIYIKKYEEYKVQMKEYDNCFTEGQREEMKEFIMGYNVSKKERNVLKEIKKLEKEMKKPKGPMSPFNVYFLKNKDSVKTKSLPEKLTLLSEKWHALSEIEKQEYKEIFSRENEQFKKELDKWEEKMLRLGHVDLVRLKTLKQKLWQPARKSSKNSN